MARHAVLQRQLHFLGEDHGHRPLLQYREGAVFGEAVGGELFPLLGVNLLAQAGQAYFNCPER
jgi:hypothetical protein